MKNAAAIRLKEQSDAVRKVAPLRYANVRSISRMREPFGEASADLPRRKFTEVCAAENTLLSNRILASLSGGDFARLAPYLEPVPLSGGEILHKPGEPARFVYFPETAVVSHLYMLADGNASEVAMIGSEGIAGLCAVFSPEQPHYWTEVTIAGQSRRIKSEIFREEFARRGGLQSLVLDYANAHISQISQKTVCNTHHVAEARLCSWLLMLQDRINDNQLPLTQDKIARYLGVNRPSITHIAQFLRESGIINYTRGFINILERKGLERSACECYEMIRENALSSYCYSNK